MIHIENATKYKGPGIYIGRKAGRWKESPLGNPFKIGRDGHRGEVIAKYREWLYERLRSSDSPQAVEFTRLYHQPDLHLVCWCAPLPCHGEVIRDLLLSAQGGWDKFWEAIRARPLPHMAKRAEKKGQGP